MKKKYTQSEREALKAQIKAVLNSIDEMEDPEIRKMKKLFMEYRNANMMAMTTPEGERIETASFINSHKE